MTTKFNNLSNLAQRAIAAVVGVTIILGGVLYNEWTFWVLFLAISILTQREFYKLQQI
jgi:phosphatidate cytidylyltransferase